MSRPAVGAAPVAQASPADRWVSRAAAATVAALAGLAGAISYSHMRLLAQEHGQAGWHAHVFPLSVDGLELVASLVLLADRRRGRRSGWLPWTALVTGTAGSLAANIATAAPDLISRTIAGWPALALLIAVKLLSGILTSHDHPASLPAQVPEPARAGIGQRDTAGRSGGSRSRSRRQPGTLVRRPARPVTVTEGRRPARQSARPDPGAGIAMLLPAARTVRDELERDGYALTRDALAAGLRRQGCRIGNARVTLLLRALRDQMRDTPCTLLDDDVTGPLAQGAAP